MDEATARQEERIKALEKQQEKYQDFCQNCREEMLGEMAGIKTDIAILRLKTVATNIVVSLVIGIIGGILASVIHGALTK